MLFFIVMEWLGVFHSITNRIAVVVLIILVGFIIGRITGRLLYRVLHEFEIDNILKRKGSSVEQSVSQVIEYVIYVITVCIALDTLGILAYSLIAAVVIVALILILSALLGVKDFIPNFLCGLWIRRKSLVSNYINLGDVRGKVIKKGWLGIKIQNKSKDIISIPNLAVLRKKWK